MKQRIKDLKERNEWFNSLPVAEKRVEIAKDVIRSLATREFENNRKYLELNDHIGGFEPQCDIQDKIESSKQDGKIFCSGCAISGLFYSSIMLGNGVKSNCFSKISYLYYDGDEIYDQMKGIFSREQLGLIESTYEGHVNFSLNRGVPVREALRFEKWGQDRRNEFNNHRENEAMNFFEKLGCVGFNYEADPVFYADLKYVRMRLMVEIMENIIKNKGTFKV